MVTAPVRQPGCPAAADLEAHAVGDLPELATHLSGCTGCAGYVAALREEQLAFNRARPPELFLQKLERRAQAPAPKPWWRWLAVLAPVGVAAALAVVLLAPPTTSGGDVTLKGGAFKVFLKGADAPLGQDAKVRAGDALRFAYDAPADGFLAVFDLDGSEAVTLFFPYGGAAPAPVRKAQGVLPGSTVLDAQRGPEWLVAVWAPTAFDVAAVSAQLKGQATRDRVSVSCEGCAVSALRLAKEGGAATP